MKNMQTGNKILTMGFVVLAVWNVIMAILGREILLHCVVAITQIGWAFQIYVTGTCRSRALKAEGRR